MNREQNDRNILYPVGKECPVGGFTGAGVDFSRLWGNQRAADDRCKEIVLSTVRARALAAVELPGGQEDSSWRQNNLRNLNQERVQPFTGTAWWANNNI